jgi:NADPH-dependent glutamate synthase beta subunit-like oxidoreductase
MPCVPSESLAPADRLLLRLAHCCVPLSSAGIIGTNLVDAEQTVDTMLRTRDSFPAVHSPRPGSAGLKALLEQRGVQAVSFQGWQRVDAAEVQRGQAQGKPREKITDVQEMLQLAAGAA